MRVSACHCGLWRFGIEWIIEMVLLVFKPQIHPAHVFKFARLLSQKAKNFLVWDFKLCSM